MAGSLNKVTLVGNVGRDPEIRTTQDGKELVNLSLATTETWKDKTSGERREKTEWHRVVVFSQPLVNLVKNYVHKGSKLYVEGSLQTRKWTDQSGVEKYTTEILLQNYNSSIILLDARNGGASSDYADKSGGHHGSQDSRADVVEDLDDEIPF